MCNDFKKDLGINIRKIRQQKKMAQEDLSLESTVSRSHIAMIEAGKRDITISALFKISRALNSNMQQIFDFDDVEKYKFNIEKFYE